MAFMRSPVRSRSGPPPFARPNLRELRVAGHPSSEVSKGRPLSLQAQRAYAKGVHRSSPDLARAKVDRLLDHTLPRIAESSATAHRPHGDYRDVAAAAHVIS